MISPNLIIIIGVIAVGIYALYNLKRNFSERLFFVIGMWLFIVQGLGNTYGIFIEFPYLPIYALIVKIASTLFNFLIAYFFYFMTKNAPASMGGAGTQLTPEEINQFLEDEKKE